MSSLTYFQTVFGLGKEPRAADLEAWILRGDEEAFARVEGRASAKQKDWKMLGLMGMKDLPDQHARARALRLVRTVKDGEALAEWLARDCGEGWITAYHRERSVALGQAPPERITPWQPDLRKTAALLQLLRSLGPTDPLFAAAFRGLDRGVHAHQAAMLLTELGCEKRTEGVHPHRRELLWLGPIVVVRATQSVCHVLAGAAEAAAFVANLPPLEVRPPKPSKPTLVSRPGVVAIWVDTVLDPKGESDGRGGPIGWYDHDFLEAELGELSGLLPQFSHAASFAEAALTAATELGISGERYVSLLYDHAYTAQPGPMKGAAGWFLGSFPFTRSRGR